MTDAGDALGRLSADVRQRLDTFAQALERIHVDDLPLYVARAREPRHRRAVEEAALVSREAGLDPQLVAAREAVDEYVIRAYAAAGPRGYSGLIGGPTFANSEEQLQILRSLGEAVTALVLGDRLDADTRGELLGLWDRLLP